jgi:hypothetical protein
MANGKLTSQQAPARTPGVVLDGVKGNSWEEGVARILEHHDAVVPALRHWCRHYLRIGPGN